MRADTLSNFMVQKAKICPRAHKVASGPAKKTTWLNTPASFVAPTQSKYHLLLKWRCTLSVTAQALIPLDCPSTVSLAHEVALTLR